jgi:hypothetical protein
MLGEICRRAVLGITLVAWPMLAGCEGAHIYVEQTNALAKKTKESYEKIDLLALAKTDRLNNDKLRDADLETTRKYYTYLRDFQIYAIITHKVGAKALLLDPERCAAKLGSFECLLTDRLIKIGTTTQDQVGDAVVLAKKQRYITAFGADPQGQVGFRRAKLQELGWSPAPSCGDNLDRIPDALRPTIEATAGAYIHLVDENLERLKQACEKLAKATPKFTGEIAKVSTLLTKAQDKAADIAERQAAAKTKLEALAAEYAAAIEAAGPDAAARQADIVDKVKKLRQGVNAAGEAFELIGEQSAFAEETIGAVDLLLQAGAGQTIDAQQVKDKPELAKAVIIAKAIPGLAAQTGAAIDDYRAPPTASLIVAKQQAAIDLDWLAAQKLLAESRLNLLSKRMTALFTEVMLLNEAQISATYLGVCEAAATADAARALCQQNWLLAMSYYSQSIVRGRVAAEAAEIDLQHLDKLELIGATEYALRSWDNLIGPPISLLAAYHAGGVKPETIADLIVKFGALGFGGVIGGKIL